MTTLRELVQSLTVKQMIEVIEQMPEDTKFSPSDCQHCIVAKVLQALSKQPICVTGVTAREAGDHTEFTDLTLLLKYVVYDFDHQFRCNIDKRRAIEFLRQEFPKTTILTGHPNTMDVAPYWGHNKGDMRCTMTAKSFASCGG